MRPPGGLIKIQEIKGSHEEGGKSGECSSQKGARAFRKGAILAWHTAFLGLCLLDEVIYSFHKSNLNHKLAQDPFVQQTLESFKSVVINGSWNT